MVTLIGISRTHSFHGDIQIHRNSSSNVQSQPVINFNWLFIHHIHFWREISTDGRLQGCFIVVMTVSTISFAIILCNSYLYSFNKFTTFLSIQFSTFVRICLSVSPYYD